MDLDQYEIAAQVGFSQMHVSRLQRRALARLRASWWNRDRAEEVAMQIMRMVLVSLGLALGGILGLAVITPGNRWAKHR